MQTSLGGSQTQTFGKNKNKTSDTCGGRELRIPAPEGNRLTATITGTSDEQGPARAVAEVDNLPPLPATSLVVVAADPAFCVGLQPASGVAAREVDPPHPSLGVVHHLEVELLPQIFVVVGEAAPPIRLHLRAG